MSNPKLKKEKGRKPSTDHRVEKRRSKKTAENRIRRTHGSRATLKETRCKMTIKIMLFQQTREWYLSKRVDSTFKHSFHPQKDEDAQKLDQDDLDTTELHYLKLMYETGVGPSSIADVMTEVLKQKGKKGDFLAQTVNNVTTQVQTAMDLVAGIDTKWSVAQKTLKRLNE